MSKLQWTEPATQAQAPNIRILLLDALRGVALLGIYWINIVVFADDSNEAFTSATGLSALDTSFVTGNFTDIFVEGTMRGLFSILFGASALVFLNEVKLATQGLEIVDRYYRRTLLLVLFGFIHAYFLLWPFDVLYVYGILGMFLFPLRKISGKILLCLGVILLILGDINIADRITSITSHEKEKIESISDIVDDTAREIVRKTLMSQPEDSNQDNPPETSENTVTGQNIPINPSISEQAKIPTWSYAQLFQKNMSDVSEHHSTKLYNDYLFDVGGMMIIGMALFKFGVLIGTRTRKFYFFLMLLSYIIGYVVRDTSIYNYVSATFHLADDFNETLLGYNLGRFIVTLGHIGLIGLLMKLNFLSRLTDLFVAIGRLALTNYIMQTIISLLIFYVFFSELISAFDQAKLIYILLLVWVFQVGFSLLWLKYFKLGPLEWIWRSLTYGKRQPIR
ncbi:MAG: DUF418 domain-containing protein [Gammaproteobacteria bacterium]|nr:DUF418 domain-containing protein [Gammaproteobacteria bacterium]